MFLETRGRSDELQKLQDAWSASGAIVVSTPFAMAEFLPSQVWQAISLLLKGAK
jgi:filamentous hemagglutinin